MPESVLTSLLAPGEFDGVAATASGDALAFASGSANGHGGVGRAWNLRTGAAGPPIPDLPDGLWAFALVPGGPVAAWCHRDRVHVCDPFTGAERELDHERAVQPDLVGLAERHGRGVVVAVFGPAGDAEVVLWDAGTGEPAGEFGVWLGHRSAIDGQPLHATGRLVGIACDAERGDGTGAEHYVGVLDVERGEEVARLAGPGRLTAVAGPVLVQAGPGELRVRRLATGDHLAALALPDAPDTLAAATVAGRTVIVTGTGDRLLTWDVARARPVHRIDLPAPATDLALAADGTLLAATRTGLHTGRLPA
ncbi:WD40 repeat domain-containing protein [Spirillospora sp. NBC_01491]|uniref:WD40 repeat domain-containing protein n=1 Tax=Spirillospora sp. NBC_01491 TaxID=2976007 RepID=UPI002E35B6CA|nr:hypothetical protein [Spirillospora sp. NBC_01491]